MVNMGKITISLDDEAEKLLRDIAKKEKRSISKQLEVIIESYDQHHRDELL